MSVEAWDLWYMGSASMPDDDVTLNIGGAIDKTIKMSFARYTAGTAVAFACRSEDVGDTTQVLTATGRDGGGELKDTGSELTLNGRNEVTATQTLERVMKVVKGATCAGNVAVYDPAAEHENTAVSGAANKIKLHSSASDTDNAYQFMVLIIESGTGIGQIREILRYDGTAEEAYVRDWDTTPDGTSVYAIHEGLVLEKETGFEINEVRRFAYDSSANPSGGAEKKYYDKMFIFNNHATLSLTNAKIDEVDLGGYAKIAFALETTLDGTGTNGAGNSRLVAPSSGIGSFDSTQKDVANSGALTAGSAQGVWPELTLAAGDAADNTFYQLEVTGQST